MESIFGKNLIMKLAIPLCLIFMWCCTKLVYNSYGNEYSFFEEMKDLSKKTWGIRPPNDNRTSFQVDFSYSMITDLITRLEIKSRPQKGDQEYVELNSLDGLTDKVLDYWGKKYDFKKRQDYLNRYPQFIQEVQGINIHYYHAESKNATSKAKYPLLVLHGMASSPAQFIGLMDVLTEQQDDEQMTFDVIVPSLPNFGFSDDQIKNPGSFGPVALAHVMQNFMKKIGYDRYFVQGNELGAEIAANMAVLYPNEVLALYSTMCRVRAEESHIVRLKTAILHKVRCLVNKEERPLLNNFKRLTQVLFGHDGHVYKPIPPVLRQSITDSPTALAAHLIQHQFAMINSSTFEPTRYIREIFLYPNDYDRIIDNVMFYWVPNKISSSLRLPENFIKDQRYKMEGRKVTVPTVCHDLISSQNRMPVLLLQSRFRDLKLKLFSLRGSTVLTDARFVNELGRSIAKSLKGIDKYHLVFPNISDSWSKLRWDYVDQYVVEFFKMMIETSFFVQRKMNSLYVNGTSLFQ